MEEAGVWLVMKSADGSERPFPLRKPRTIIGRDHRCDLRVALPTIETNHCEIVLEAGQAYLKPIGEASVTRVNGVVVGQVELKHADTIELGSVALEVRVGGFDRAD